MSTLLTVLIGRGPSSVAIAAAVLLAGGLALSAAVAPFCGAAPRPCWPPASAPA